MYSDSYRYNPKATNPYSVYKQLNPNIHNFYSVYKKTIRFLINSDLSELFRFGTPLMEIATEDQCLVRCLILRTEELKLIE